MRTGECPGCRRRMLLVAVWSCSCGVAHNPPGACAISRANYVVREHACGRRLPPLIGTAVVS